MRIVWWVLQNTGQILKQEGVIAESNAGENSHGIKSICSLESVEAGWLDDLSKSSSWRGRERRRFVGCRMVKRGEEGKLRVQTLHCINSVFTGKVRPRRSRGRELKAGGGPTPWNWKVNGSDRGCVIYWRRRRAGCPADQSYQWSGNLCCWEWRGGGQRGDHIPLEWRTGVQTSPLLAGTWLTHGLTLSE